MARMKGATYFNMKGGLNTEASPLNIPNTDAVEAENIDINIDGSISRRRAFDFLGESTSGNLFLSSNISDYTAIVGSEFKTEVASFSEFNPIDDSGAIQRHVVMHYGNEFYIYDYSDPQLLRELDDPGTTLDQSAYSDQQALHHTTLLQNGNRLYTVNRQHPFGYIEYDDSAGTFSWTLGDVQHRVNGASSSSIEDVISDDSGWLTGCLSNSRVWLAGADGYPNTVFFSQTIVDGDEYVKMYQEDDPFGAGAVLVATDGGSIRITGAERILALANIGNGVVAFANNGVWYIGGSDGFLPTNYQVNKISDSGIAGTTSWCAVEQQLVYFGNNDIYTVLLGTAIETPEVQPVGNKIVSFYNTISLYNKQASKAVYEPNLKKIFFFTNFSNYTYHVNWRYVNHHSLMRDVLVFDVRLAAWSVYKLSADSTGTKLAFADANILSGGRVLTEIVTDSGTEVTDGGESVVAQDVTETSASKFLTVLLQKRNGDSWDIGIGSLTTSGLVDFATSTNDSESNDAFMTTAHQVFNDVAHAKFTPYIIPIFERMESGTVDSNGDDLTPGGCQFRIDWNWSTNSNSSKYGTLRTAYFPNKYTTSWYGGGDTGYEIVSSKLKVRGRGDVMRIHFRSDGDKDFKLYGWQLMINAKPRM